MLLHKSAEHDGRVRRKARALFEADHQPVIVHLPEQGGPTAGAEADARELRSATPGQKVGRLPGPLRRFVTAGRIARIARRERPDAVHAHDAAMLAPGWIVARRTGAKLRL